MSWLSIALLACAVLAVIGAEWPRLARNFGFEARRRRDRDRRKAQLKLLRTDEEELDESDDFAASVAARPREPADDRGRVPPLATTKSR